MNTAVGRRIPFQAKPDAPYDWGTFLWGGWFLAGLLDTGVHMYLTWDAPPALARWDAHLVGLGRHVALGYLAAGIYWLCRRWFTLSWGLVAWGGMAAGIAAFTLPRDLGGFAARLGKLAGVPTELVLTLFALALGSSMPLVSLAVLRPMKRPWVWLQWLGAVFGAALATFANVNVSPGLNPSAHLFLTWLTAVSLGPFAVLGGIGLRRVMLGRVRRGPAIAIYQVPFGLALWSCLGPNAHGAWLAYIRRPHYLVGSAFIKTERGPIERDSKYSPPNDFFRPRATLAAVPPSGALAVAKPIVLVLTFDSLRADVVGDAEFIEYLPNLHALKQRGAYFTTAFAPASRTVNTLASIVTGTYFSQQYWTDNGVGLSLAEDVTPQFPEALTAAGVETRFFPPIEQLAAPHGPFKGFLENRFVEPPEKAPHVSGKDLTQRLLATLATQPERAKFSWVHYLDSHVPYAAGNPESDPFRRYLRSLRVTDEYLGLVVNEVQRLGLGERTFFIVSADHGEAFGEHGSWHHGSTLYNEQIKVPLLIAGPDVQASNVDVPVSLVDLAPTILDLNGLPTPGVCLGQTLVPLLRGETPPLVRPIVAETGFKRAMFFAGSLKLIRDWQYGTTELYDLSRDELELENLADTVSTSQHIIHLRQFFAAHPHHSTNYEVFHNK